MAAAAAADSQDFGVQAAGPQPHLAGELERGAVRSVLEFWRVLRLERFGLTTTMVCRRQTSRRRRAVLSPLVRCRSGVRCVCVRSIFRTAEHHPCLAQQVFPPAVLFSPVNVRFALNGWLDARCLCQVPAANAATRGLERAKEYRTPAPSSQPQANVPVSGMVGSGTTNQK